MTRAEIKPSIARGAPLGEDPDLGPLTLGGYLREIAQRHAAREAVVMSTDAGAIRWSYRDLWAESAALARALAGAGVVKGTRVGLLMTNRLEFLSGLFGTALAGGIAVPLSTFSTADELEYLLQASCCTVVLVECEVQQKDFAAVLTDLEPGLRTAQPGTIRSLRFPHLRYLAAVDRSEPDGAIESWRDFLAGGASIAPELIDAAAAAVAPADAGSIFFSSGSTARPKGILSSHRAAAIQFWRWPRLFGLESDVRVWTANGLFWAGTFSSAVGSALSCGGTLVLQRIFDPEPTLSLLERERVNFPLAWAHQWAKLEEAPNWPSVDLSAMRYVNPQTPIGRHPSVKTDWDEPVHSYGNTETFTVSAIHPSGTPQAEIRGSRGVPLPGNTFKIVDPTSGAVVPLGERGEIAVKGPTLMLGYLGQPLDETLDDEGFLRTGDGGYLDADGRLYWEGRLSDVIKTGGANVSPVEVDLVLSRMPGVKVGQTVGVPHETLGELVVACIVPNEGVVLDEQGVRAFVKASLASYKVPRRVLFFSESDLAQTGNAKIKTADLRKLVLERLEREASSGS